MNLNNKSIVDYYTSKHKVYCTHDTLVVLVNNITCLMKYKKSPAEFAEGLHPGDNFHGYKVLSVERLTEGVEVIVKR